MTVAPVLTRPARSRPSEVETAIIGAGPYGLSIAAHLRRAGFEFRVFGKPMETWTQRMPDGMFLKSEGFASNISDPDDARTLKDFCRDSALRYGDYAVPVSIETFRRYGLAFKRALVPEVDERLVTALNKSDRFELRLDDGERLRARRVIVATGFTHFERMPPEFEALSPELVTHTSAHLSFDRFRGHDVTVIGAGQSALETAALLHEAGATTRVFARKPAVAWNGDPALEKRSLVERLNKPMSPLGRGKRLWIYSSVPGMFRVLSEPRRIATVRQVQGPAGAWWLRERVIGRFPVEASTRVVRAEEKSGRVVLHLDQEGRTRYQTTDHVIVGTGYHVDLSRLEFLGEAVRSLRLTGSSPVLSRQFESSIPGLHFVGLAAANSFGPIMRFAAGAEFTAKRMASVRAMA